MTRTTFTQASDSVKISYIDYFSGNQITRSFWVPLDGGYVREGNDRQVCHKLRSTGCTLISTRATLLDDIRREYRAMRRSEVSCCN